MPSQIVAVYGSSRVGGNTDTLLDLALEQVDRSHTIHRVYARNLKIEGCRACGGCDRTGQCVIMDEMQSVYPLLKTADVLVFATPVYFYSVPAQLKAIIDRCQACWSMRQLNRDAFPPGSGYLLGVGATRGRRLFDGIQLTMRYCFDAVGKEYAGDLLVSAMDEREAVMSHPDVLAAAREFGATITSSKEDAG